VIHLPSVLSLLYFLLANGSIYFEPGSFSRSPYLVHFSVNIKTIQPLLLVGALRLLDISVKKNLRFFLRPTKRAALHRRTGSSTGMKGAPEDRSDVALSHIADKKFLWRRLFVSDHREEQ